MFNRKQSLCLQKKKTTKHSCSNNLKRLHAFDFKWCVAHQINSVWHASKSSDWKIECNHRIDHSVSTQFCVFIFSAIGLKIDRHSSNSDYLVLTPILSSCSACRISVDLFSCLHLSILILRSFVSEFELMIRYNRRSNIINNKSIRFNEWTATWQPKKPLRNWFILILYHIKCLYLSFVLNRFSFFLSSFERNVCNLIGCAFMR